MKFQGKTIIVTGGASGLGEAVVREVVSRGGRALVLDLNRDRGEALEKELGSENVLFRACDITSEAPVEEAIDAAVARFGGVHGTVQCAGVANPRRVLNSRGALHSLKAFELVLKINVTGTFNVLRLATARMAKQPADPETGERGVHVLTASVAAFDGQIGQAAYSASKGAVAAMTLPVARDLASLGIRVVTVAPGIFQTPMMAKMPPKAYESLSRQVPFPKRLGHPAEFASLVATIFSNRYLNGETIRLDGSIRMSAM